MEFKNESWVEKYRPKKLNEIVSQENIMTSIKGFLNNKNIPHLLLFGPSGCGKTSTIIALAREIFGDNYKDRVMEFNASDERGIKFIRTKIKMYAQKSINIKKGIPDYKIIILDEADSMTSESQYALRKIMENYSKITRFCIICNYHTQIIDPIISRCSLLRFKAIEKIKILKKLKEVCSSENIYCSNNNLKLIVEICRGDLRKSINFLQRCNKNKNFLKKNDNSNELTQQMIFELSGFIPKDLLEIFIDNCINKNINKVNNYIKYFYNSSYSLTNQIHILTILILNNNKIDDIKKSKIILHLLEIDRNLLNGCDEYIQFFNLAYFIIQLIN
jgi:replication factor C subunit 2/4